MKMLFQLMLVVVIFAAIPVHALEIVDETEKSNILKERWDNDKNKIGVAKKIDRGLGTLANWSGVGQLPGVKPVNAKSPRLHQLTVGNARIVFLHIGKYGIILAKFRKEDEDATDYLINAAYEHAIQIHEKYTPPKQEEKNPAPSKRRKR